MDLCAYNTEEKDYSDSKASNNICTLKTPNHVVGKPYCARSEPLSGLLHRWYHRFLNYY